MVPLRGRGMQNVYEPREDSYLLQKEVKKYAHGDVLDMGTGSGIQAITASESKKVKSVLAVDLNRHAVKYVSDLVKKEGLKKIKVLHSDLFSNIQNKKFDTIIFNPPYLPEDEREPSDEMKRAISGGRHGWEVLSTFIDHAVSRLNNNGNILIVFSSLTNKEKVEEIVSSHLLDFKKLSQQNVGFETLYVYLITKSNLLQKFEKHGISDVKVLAKGHRGLVYKGNYKGKPVAIKIANCAAAKNRIGFEVQWLKKLNPLGIGPKLILHDGDYFVMEYVDGVRIMEYIDSLPSEQPATKAIIKKVLSDVFNTCYKLDQMKIEKQEMHSPYKHIIVGNNVKLIDFERARSAPTPKNVTQFCQFVTSTNVFVALREKGFSVNRDRIRKLCQWYKRNPSEKNLDTILKELK